MSKATWAAWMSADAMPDYVTDPAGPNEAFYREDATDRRPVNLYWKSRVDRGEDDLGNAERFVIDHQHSLRYAQGLGWLTWDGKRWRRDGDGEAERCAKDTVRRIKFEAILLEDRFGALESDEEKDIKKRADRRFAHATRSAQQPRLAAILTTARSEPRLVVTAERLDADPMLMTVSNGTIDLRTGELLAHDAKHLITRLAGVEYDPDAHSARFERFIAHVTGGDRDTADFLQRAAGYTLTGDTGEECLFFLFGPGATGKTTLLEALKSVLGDYGATAAFNTLTTRREHGPSGDLARLAGVRLVASSEVGRGAAFNAETVKTLTGGDTVVAAFKYRDEFEYRPRFKLWLAANDQPAVDFDDDAMRRRIKLIPLSNVVPAAQRDPQLKKALTTDPAERAAVLAWAVAGCLAWQRDGLGEPAAVTRATAAYFEAQDPLADWLADCCDLDPSHRATRADVRRSYEVFARNHGLSPITPQAFASALRTRGITDGGKNNGTRWWSGIRVDTVRGRGADEGTEGGNSAGVGAREDEFTDEVPPSAPLPLFDRGGDAA